MAAFQLVILDLVSDSSEGTSQQMKDFVKKQQVDKIWPESVHEMSHPNGQTDSNDVKDNACEMAIRHLFEIKRKMDDDRKSDFVLVTSLLLKKYWEKVCCSLFAAVHNWVVYGVPIADQSWDNIKIVVDLDIDAAVRNVLMTMGNPDEIEILRPRSIPKEMFNAGFSTRKGGVSSLAPMASMNMLYTSRKVDPKAVIDENRRRLATAAGFDPSKVMCVNVEHGNTIRVHEKDFPDRCNYDGHVTNTPGVTLFAVGADCCPIILADTVTGACGAVHAGWRGTVSGAVRELLKAMVREYGTKPVNVRAAIGPSVEMTCFSLTESEAKPLADLDPSLTRPNPDKAGLVGVDLVRANVIMLEQDGVLLENVDTKWAFCTKCNGDRFFSHQRDGVPFGNQVCFVSCIKK